MLSTQIQIYEEIPKGAAEPNPPEPVADYEALPSPPIEMEPEPDYDMLQNTQSSSSFADVVLMASPVFCVPKMIFDQEFEVRPKPFFVSLWMWVTGCISSGGIQ
jgi:hypothetical protein